MISRITFRTIVPQQFMPVEQYSVSAGGIPADDFRGCTRTTTRTPATDVDIAYH